MTGSAMMTNFLAGIRCQVIVLAAALSLASFFGGGAMVAVLVAAVSVILPEIMYVVLVSRILNSEASVQSKIAQAFRCRLFKMATTIAFLALSLRAVGNDLAEVAFWALTVAAMVLLPGWIQLAGSVAVKDKRKD